MTLAEAEESLFQTGEVSDESDRKKLVESRSRRLYDIMNILKFLGIADKSRYGDRKNTFIRRVGIADAIVRKILLGI
jgi:hypothetical protein